LFNFIYYFRLGEYKGQNSFEIIIQKNSAIQSYASVIDWTDGNKPNHKKVVDIIVNGLNNDLDKIVRYVLEVKQLIVQCLIYINKNMEQFDNEQFSILCGDLKKLINC